MALTACGGDSTSPVITSSSTLSTPATPTTPSNPTMPATSTTPTTPTVPVAPTVPSSSNGTSVPVIPAPSTSTTGPITLTTPIQNGLFKFSEFERYSVSSGVGQPTSDALGRTDYTLSNGALNEMNTTVFGTQPYTDYLTKTQNMAYYAGHHLLSIQKDNTVGSAIAGSLKILNDHQFQFMHPNSTLTTTLTVSPYLIEGLGQHGSGKTGILTDLDILGLYSVFNGFTFPSGSICYNLSGTDDQANYYFYAQGNEKAIALKDWVTQQTTTANIMGNDGKPLKANNIVYENVGANDDLPAVHFTDQDGDYHAAIIYNGLTYEADYSDGVNPTYRMNLDPTKGLVSCDSYNSVAADAMAAYAKKTHP